jgi:uncharacterized protein DUF6946
MNNRIYIPATKPEDWKALLADPEKHWRKGYSAMSLTYAWQSVNGFPPAVKHAFKESGIDLFQGTEILFAFPEHQVSLPGGSAASQNDLYVLAKGKGQLISIAVEGKVSEPFDKKVSEWFQNPSKGKRKRLEYLCGQLGLDMDQVYDIRYQLLHRTASAVIEAERFNATSALMLVHSFSKTMEWFQDYADFASLYGIDADPNRIYPATSIHGIGLYLGWVSDEIDE